MVQKGKRKPPRVKKGYSLDGTGDNLPKRAAGKQVYAGVPVARQNRNEFVMRAELQDRNLTDKKLLYVSKYNKGQAKSLQRR